MLSLTNVAEMSDT